MSSDKGAKCANYDWRCLTRAWKVGGVGRAHSWAKSQKPAKNEIQKIREIDESYLCLQRFDKFWMWSAGNRKRKLCKFAETCMEKTRDYAWTYFRRVSAIWNHCESVHSVEFWTSFCSSYCECSISFPLTSNEMISDGFWNRYLNLQFK